MEDYLNDKIQVSSDLENLDSLLSSLCAQQELQRRQLAEAQEALSNATKASNDHAEATRKRAEAFNEQQVDIDRRLKAITQSDVSDEAVRRFERNMEKLRRLEISKGYVGLLKEVDALSKDVQQNISSAPSLALKPYSRLRNIVFSLKDAQPAAEGAAPHLVDHTAKLASVLREEMKANFIKRLQKTLEQMKWPVKDLHLTDSLVSQWKSDVELLLGLQIPELEEFSIISGDQNVEPPILFPMEVMVHPLELRFKYHFSSDKPTNKLDKPEYFLFHITDLITAHGSFFAKYLQPIFDEKTQTVEPGLKWHFYSAPHAFITALFPMLREKISTCLPQVSSRPQLLSHFIHQLMTFDNEIREMSNYTPYPSSNENWKGMSWEVLTKQGWFDRWLQVEKDFALARYKEIIDAPDSGELDYDGVEPFATKPTKASIRVNDLLETITERYQPLSSFSQKLRFLIDVQITIFDQFHARLRSALEAYLAMTSAIGRTVQGSDAQSVEGVAGLERLCRVFGSAEYLEKKMEDWSNDVFFVELWIELQERVQRNKYGGKNVAGPMSVADVATRTSSAVVNNYGQEATSDGALFDETASVYRHLRLRSETVLTSTLCSDTISALKPYSRTSTWATLSSAAAVPAAAPFSPSSDLAPATRTLSASISFLSRALGVAPLRRIVRQLLQSIQAYIWDNVLMRHNFSAAGAAQFSGDVGHLCSVVDVALGVASSQGDSERVIKKLNEALLLLCLDASASSEASIDNNSTVPLGGNNLAESEPRALPGLWEVEKRLFKDNKSAREVLSELGMEILTESEARMVLERRVEIGS